MIYKKIALKDRPFVVHVFVKATAFEVASKLNRIRNKSEKFNPSEFTMDSDTDAQTCYLEHSLPGQYVIMFTKLSIEAIAHEVWHVVMDHGRYIGLKHDQSSEESFAYLFGYLIKEIYELKTGSK
mgnify:FL=1